MKKLMVLLLAIMFAFTACGGEEETASSEATTAEPPVVITIPDISGDVEIPEETEALPEGYMRSYLTNEIIPMEIGTRRPVAFQIDNEKLAMPQNAIAQAEVVYEVPIEANEVRMTAIIQDWGDIERIGPLRSARSYHPGIVYEFDGIFFHNGHSDIALYYLDDDHCDHLEGIENSGWPCIVKYDDHTEGHNDFTTPAKIDSRVEKLGFRQQISDDFTYKWKFAKEDAPNMLEEGRSAKKVSIGFTQNKPWFEYDDEDGLYYRYAREVAHIDQDNGEQVAVKNIIVQYCDYNLEWDKNTKDIHTVGSGKGVYITNGKAVDITWEKDEYWGNTLLFDADGNELRLNTGKTWYCIVLDSFTGEITTE